MIDRRLDSYAFSTGEESALIEEIAEMERNSQWISGIVSHDIELEAIDGPLAAMDVADKTGINYDIVLDTAQAGTSLTVNADKQIWCVRDTARTSLCETAKLFGSALGRMTPYLFSETINHGLHVARGRTLLLERYGKASAFMSAAAGGYCIMPISELLASVVASLSRNFGTPDFILGTNTHSLTEARWELPDAQGDILTIYQDALAKSGSHCYATNFMPTVRFRSSDTGLSCAMLIPEFKLRDGVYFRLTDGISVKHEQRKDGGMEKFKDDIEDIYSQYQAIGTVVADLASIDIQNPCNCVVSLCKKYSIPKKYGDVAREKVERFCINSPILSAHDIYLSMAEVVGAAIDGGASDRVISNLEESISKILRVEWRDHDVGGIVAWN